MFSWVWSNLRKNITTNNSEMYSPVSSKYIAVLVTPISFLTLSVQFPWKELSSLKSWTVRSRSGGILVRKQFTSFPEMLSKDCGVKRHRSIAFVWAVMLNINCVYTGWTTTAGSPSENLGGPVKKSDKVSWKNPFFKPRTSPPRLPVWNRECDGLF